MASLRHLSSVFALSVLSATGVAQRAHVAPPLPRPLRPMFGGPQYVSWGYSTDLGKADLDADGDTDLVVAQEYSYVPESEAYPPVLAVLRNQGNGAFGSAERSALPVDEAESIFLAIGDLDGDGSPDLAPAYAYGSSEVAVLLNLGNGQFAVHGEYGITGDVRSILGADLDHDGDLDLATATPNPRALVVLRNQGNATFVPSSQFLLPVDVLQTSADLDLDGDVDLVEGEDQLDVLENLGTGSFSLDGSYVVGDNANAAHADLDRDGYEDLVTSNGSVLLNLGNGGFAPPVTYETGALGDTSATVADLDGDTDLDVVLSNRFSGPNVAVLANLGNGELEPVVHYAVGRDPQRAIAADLNGNGYADVASLGLSGAVTVLHNRRDGTFSPTDRYPVGIRPFFLVDADLDGDGDPELAAAHLSSSWLSLLWNAGDGSFPVRSDLPIGAGSACIAALDLNGDGWVDLAAATGGHTVAVLLNQGSGTFATYAAHGGSGSKYVTGADLDGDGNADLAAAHFDSDEGNNCVLVLENEGDGTFAPEVQVPLGAVTLPLSIASADVDRDGDIDLATANLDHSGFVRSPDIPRNLTVLSNLGDGTFGSPIAYAAYEAESLTSLDLDEDGDVDLVTAGVAVHSNLGDGTFAAPVVYTVSLSLFVTSADMDRDGDVDLVATSYDSALALLRNRGDGSFRLPLLYAAGYSSAGGITSADVDGDGDVDLATSDYSLHTVAVHRNLRR